MGILRLFETIPGECEMISGKLKLQHERIALRYWPVSVSGQSQSIVATESESTLLTFQSSQG
jgi:hypothetical protein